MKESAKHSFEINKIVSQYSGIHFLVDFSFDWRNFAGVEAQMLATIGHVFPKNKVLQYSMLLFQVVQLFTQILFRWKLQLCSMLLSS